MDKRVYHFFACSSVVGSVDSSCNCWDMLGLALARRTVDPGA